MKTCEMEALNRLSPGEYAFNSNRRVVFLEITEHPGEYFANEMKFSMFRLDKDEEKVVIAQQGGRGVEVIDSLSGLSRENRQIVMEFAIGRLLQEGEIAQIA